MRRRSLQGSCAQHLAGPAPDARRVVHVRLARVLRDGARCRFSGTAFAYRYRSPYFPQMPNNVLSMSLAVDMTCEHA